MLKVAITGGIGSGKSTVARIFKTLGVPVYDADAAAKHLMHTDPQIKKEITALFGARAYAEGVLDRGYIAQITFTDKEKLEQLNRIVHPATIDDNRKWFLKQTTPYAIKEAAILFESGSDQYVDYIIGVYSNEPLRISRVMIRNNLTELQVRERMSQQMNEEEKMRKCDYVIDNNGERSVIEQVMKVHALLSEKAVQVK